jgi:hypothetical protein
MQPADPLPGVLERARRLGPLPYSGRGANTRPELPPDLALAGWMVDAVDTWWAQLRRPDPLTVIEVGAGGGSRAAAFLGWGPASLAALRYVLVEADGALRRDHATHLPIESPIFVLGPVEAAPEDDDITRPVEGIGPLVTSLGEVPVVDGPAVILALGWLSRQPSDRLEWRHGAWWEVRLAAGPGDELSEVLVPLDEERAVAAEALISSTARPEGSRFAQLGLAVDWLAQTLRVAESGRLAVVDRWSPLTRPLAPGEVPPLALDQLAAVRRPLEPAPVELFPGLAVQTWRLG